MALRAATTQLCLLMCAALLSAGVYGAADCAYNSSALKLNSWGFRHQGTANESCLQVGRVGLEGSSAWPFWRELQLYSIIEDAANTPENQSSHSVIQCRTDLRHYLDGLGNFSLWAVRMWDSSAHTLRGALWGELVQLGNFDECLALEEAEQDIHLGEDSLEPSYCLAKISVSSQDEVGLTDQYMGTAWQKIKRAKHRLALSRHATEVAMCLPASCTGQTLATVLKPSFTKIGQKHGFKIDIEVPDDACQTRKTLQEDSNVPTPVFVLLGVYAMWLTICMLVDDGQQKSSSIISAFSIRRQWTRLTSYSTSVEPASQSEDISVLHGLRVLCVIIVLLGHRGEALTSGPLLNGKAIEEMFTDPWNLPVLNGSLIVDVFFVMSGLLLSWSVLGRLLNGKSVDILLHWSLRYLRLTPALAAVVALQAQVVPALGTGPLWRRLAVREADRCRKYWWTNLLHIGNVVHADTPCIDPTWYIACDSQLFLTSLVGIAWLYRRPQLTKTVVIGALALAMGTPAIITAVLGLDPTVIPDPETVGHTASTIISQAVYVTSYCRAGPYIVGLTLGFWLHSVRRLNYDPVFQLSKVGRSLLRWAALAAFVTSLFGIALFYPPLDTLTPRIVAVIYAGVHRTLFAFGVAVFIGAAASGRGGLLAKWLSAPWFRPLSRLSYSIYLIHSSIQMLSYAAVRSPQLLSTGNSILLTVPDILFALLGGLILHLTVEGPITTIVILFGPKKSNESESNTSNTEKSDGLLLTSSIQKADGLLRCTQDSARGQYIFKKLHQL